MPGIASAMRRWRPWAILGLALGLVALAHGQLEQRDAGGDNAAPEISLTGGGQVRPDRSIQLTADAYDKDADPNDAERSEPVQVIGYFDPVDSAPSWWTGSTHWLVASTPHPELKIDISVPEDAQPSGPHTIAVSATDSRGLTTMGEFEWRVVAPLCSGSLQHDADGTCAECPAHSVPNVSKTACDPCAADTERAAGAASCTACATGMTSAPGTACGCGSAKKLEAGACVACPPHTDAGADPATCAACPENHQRLAGMNACAPCPTGEISASGGACAPGVGLTISGPSGPADGAFDVTFEFTESVTGFALTDIEVRNGTAGALTGGGASYGATITPIASFEGTVTVDVPASAAEDGDRNGNGAASLAVTVDRTAPTLEITGPSGTQTGVFAVTFEFSESVTGFAIADIAVGNGTAGDLSGSGARYTASITPASSGAVKVDVGADAAEDAAGHGNTAAAQLSVTASLSMPTVTIGSAESSPVNGAFGVTFTFSESVTGFGVGDISVGNGATGSLTGSGAGYAATITPTAGFEGTVTVDVPADAARNADNLGNSAAVALEMTVDRTAPTVAINGPEGPQNGDFTATFTFDEAVTGFAADDIAMTNGAASGFSGAGTTYSAIVAATADGEVKVAVAADAALDAAGNGSAAAAALAVEVDRTAPGLAISGPTGTQAGAFEATFTFDEAVTGFALTDIAVGNGAASALQGSGANYSAIITPTTSGTVTVDGGADAAFDAAGNGSTAASRFSVEANLAAPTASVTSAATSPVNGAFDVTVTFSESVTGFALGDIDVTGGSASNLTGAGPSYAATITPASGFDGTLSVRVPEDAATGTSTEGNAASSRFSITVDQTAPTAILAGASTPQNGAFSVTALFSETVTGFELDDFAVTNGTASAFAGSGATYSATVTPTADGAVTVDLPADAADDAAGNGSAPAERFSVDYDGTTPTLSISGPSGAQGGAFDVTFTFDEDVTGFALADIAVGNGSAGSFAGSGASYSATITPTASGAVTVDVAGDAATDAAGNGNAAADRFSVAAALAGPTVTITSAASSPVKGAFTATFTFSQAVTGFTLADIEVGFGAASGLNGSGAGYAATITPSAGFDGTLTVNVAANAAQNASNEGNVAAAEFSMAVDQTAPLVEIRGPDAPRNAAFDITVVFSESVTGFAVNDIAVTNGSAGRFAGSGSTYTARIAPVADGAVTVDVAADAAADAAGNGNTAATRFAVDYDATAPTLDITGPTSAQGGVFTVNFAFDEDVTGFGLADIDVGNGSAANLTGAGASYSASITPAASGAVTVDVDAGAARDAAGNRSAAAARFSVTASLTSPTVTISSTATPPVKGAFTVAFAFSESVTGFGLDDIAVGNGSASNLSGAGTSYSANITPAARFTGALTVRVPAGAAVNGSNNGNSASAEFRMRVDQDAPTVAIDGPDEPQNGAFDVTVVFSEPVTGFLVNDIAVGNGSAGGFSGTDATYAATITPVADGKVTLDIVADAAFDAAGNGNAAAAQFAVTVDRAAPTPTITTSASAPVDGAFVIAVAFGESVAGFAIADIAVGNGTASGFSGAGASYAATITPDADGSVTVDIGAGAATDAAGNASAAAARFSIEASLASNATRIVLSTASATVNEDAGTLTVTMSLQNPPSSGQYRQCGLRAVSTGTTAAATDDYTLPNNTRWLQPNNSYSVDIDVTLVDDTDIKGDKTLVLEGFCNKTHGNPGTTHDQLAATPLTVTIADNDTPTPTLVLSTSSATPAEDAGTVTVTMTLKHPPDSGHYRECGLRAVSAGTTATAADDYTLPNNTRWLRAATGWTVDIDVTVVDDTDVEGDKTLVLEGFCAKSQGDPDPTHDQLRATPLTLTIAENDVAPTVIALSVASNTVAEDTGTLDVTMSVQNPPSSGHYRQCGLRAVSAGTTAAATDDYTLPNNTRWLQPSNSFSVDISVAVVDDSDIEDDETLVLEGFCGKSHGDPDPTHDELQATPLTLTIEDNENAAPAFDASGPAARSVAENTGTDTAFGDPFPATDPEDDTLTYSLDGTDSASFSIDTATGQLKTKAALDHEADGEYEVTVGVSDRKDLSGNADTVVDATVAVTITVTDEDEPPAAPAAPTVTAAATDGHTTLDVSWTAPLTDGIPAITDYTVEYRKKTVDDSETWTDHPFAGDGTATSIVGLDPSTTYQVQVAATNDEGTGAFSGPGEGATDAAALTAEYAAAAYSVTEGGDAVTIEVTLTPAAHRAVTVPIAVTADTAESGDYTVAGLTGNALEFGVGDTSKTFTITPNEDADNEHETVTLGFGTITDSDLTAGRTGALTITDDEPRFVDSPPVTRSVAENTTADTAIGSAVTATDANSGDTLLYSLDGSDKDAFDIETATGRLKTKAALDHEDDAEYSVTVGVSDQKDVDGNADTAVDATINVTISVTDEDEPPAAPAAPTVTAAGTNGHTTLDVDWTAPSTTGIPAIDDYTVEYRRKTADDSETWTDHAFAGAATTTSIASLDSNTTYQVQVSATNDEGTSGFSGPGEGKTDSATPECAALTSQTGPPTSSNACTVGVYAENPADTAAVNGACSTAPHNCTSGTHERLPDIPPNHGRCATVVDTCTAGAFRDLVDTATHSRWQCLGVNGTSKWNCNGVDGAWNWSCTAGGTTDTSCTAPTGVGGSSISCSAQLPSRDPTCEIALPTCAWVMPESGPPSSTNACTVGTFNDTSDVSPVPAACGTGTDNSCAAGNRLEDTSDAAAIHGSCGSAVNTCTNGTLEDVADSLTHAKWKCLGADGTSKWKCHGVDGVWKWQCLNGGISQQCSDPSGNIGGTASCEGNGDSGSDDACEIELPVCASLTSQTGPPSSSNACSVGTYNHFPVDQYHVRAACGNGTENSCAAGNTLQDVSDIATVHGSCGSAVDTCTDGTFEDVADSLTHAKWKCLGADGTSKWKCHGVDGVWKWQCLNGGVSQQCSDPSGNIGGTASCELNGDSGSDDACEIELPVCASLTSQTGPPSSSNACSVGTYNHFPVDQYHVRAACGDGTENSCAAGNTLEDISDAAAIHGSCGSAVDTCTDGTFEDVADSSTHAKWKCLGADGTTNWKCHGVDGVWKWQCLNSGVSQQCSDPSGNIGGTASCELNGDSGSDDACEIPL